MTVSEIMRDLVTYRNYFKSSGGGVTITGGEPFVQSGFMLEILQQCRQQGIHTVVDTSGYTSEKTARKVLPYTDLVLMDMKGYWPQTFKEVTGVDQAKSMAFLNLTREMGIDVWIRYVLVPGLTDNLDEIQEMKAFLDTFPNVKKIDVLPFHKHGEDKWAQLKKFKYNLGDTPPPSKELVRQVRSMLAM